MIPILMLAGCKCVVNVSGVVLDLYTNDPIGGAIIEGVGFATGGYQTDTTGTFEFQDISGLEDCEISKFEVFAEGYTQRIVEITNGSHIEVRLDSIR